MIRRTLKSLKPISLALLVLVLAPCVVEFAFRIVECRWQLETKVAQSRLATSPSWYTHHELEPLQRTSVPADENQVSVELRTNSLGLRGPEIRIPKRADTLRIVCLGDEAVLAAAVDEPQTFCQLVQNSLQSRTNKRVEVINAGVPDFCPLLSYLQLRHRLLILDPDIVIAHFDMSDVWDDRRFRRLTELSAQEEPLLCAAPGLSSVAVTQPFTQNFLSWQWAQNKLSSLVGQQRRLQTSAVDDPRSRYAWLTDESSLWALQTELSLSPLIHLANLCQEQRIRLLLAAHPVPWQLSATASRGARIPEQNGIFPGTLIETTRPEEMIADFAMTTALPLCDAISILRGHSSVDDLFQPDSAEFSEVGHRYYAAALTASLLEQFPEIASATNQYSPTGRAVDSGRPVPLNQPVRDTQQPMALQPILPAGFSTGPQGSANRPATTQSTTRSTLDQPRSSVPSNALVPFSDRR
jgi:hypothetical protein